MTISCLRGRFVFTVIFCVFLCLWGVVAPAEAETPLDALAASYDLYDEALAYSHIDFASVPSVETEAALADYLWACRTACVRKIPLKLAPGLSPDRVAALREHIDWHEFKWQSLPAADGGVEMLIHCEVRPGACIGDAYLRGDTEGLDAGEAQVLQMALDFFGNAYPAEADAITRERAIYDFLLTCVERTGAEADISGETAVDALLRGMPGRAGIMDAFAMLCTMAGIPNHIVMETNDQGTQAWNVVEIDGQWLLVDPALETASGQSIPYFYFNVGLDFLPGAYTPDLSVWPVTPQARTGSAYAYGNAAFPELIRAADRDALAGAILSAIEAEPVCTLAIFCERFEGSMEDFFDALCRPCDDDRYLPVAHDGIQVRKGEGVFMRLEMERLDLRSPYDEGAKPDLDRLLARYDLYDDDLDPAQIDFYALPRIDSADALYTFMSQCRDRMARQIPLRLAPSMDPGVVSEMYEYFDWAMVEILSMPNRANESHLLVHCSYLAGANIAEAYRAGDLSTLTEDEQAVYEIASEYFKTEYPWSEDAVTRERSIFDFVQGSSVYWQNRAPAQSLEEVSSAVDVFVHGRATCTGFADAFSMLCTMAGFSVYSVPGAVDGEPHIWNMIELDGQWYMVDATHGTNLEESRGLGYMFFNAGRTLMSQSYRWVNTRLPRPVVDQIDGQYAFGNGAFPELYRVADADALRALLIERAREAEERERVELYVMCDAFAEDMEAFMEDLTEPLEDGRRPVVYGGTQSMVKETLYMHITIGLTPYDAGVPAK